LGRLTYLEVKARGEHSRSGTRWPSGGVQGGVPQDPRDMAKLRREALCCIPDAVGKNSEERS
jgi:hypothetical protein